MIRMCLIAIALMTTALPGRAMPVEPINSGISNVTEVLFQPRCRTDWLGHRHCRHLRYRPPVPPPRPAPPPR